MDNDVARNTERHPVPAFKSKIREGRPRLDVVRLKIAPLVISAMAADEPVSVENVVPPPFEFHCRAESQAVGRFSINISRRVRTSTRYLPHRRTDLGTCLHWKRDTSTRTCLALLSHAHCSFSLGCVSFPKEGTLPSFGANAHLHPPTCRALGGKSISATAVSAKPRADDPRLAGPTPFESVGDLPRHLLWINAYTLRRNLGGTFRSLNHG